MPRKWLLVPVWVGIVCLLLLWSGCFARVCSEAERNVLAEFPQYGDIDVTAEDNRDTGACAVYYQVPDSPDPVRE